MKNKTSLGSLYIVSLIIGLAFTGVAMGQTSRSCAPDQKSSSEAIAGGSAGVVINEAYGGSELGGIYNADFIELYNPSASPADISDFSVQYYTAGQINGGAPTSTAHIPAATTIAPFGYYVIRVSPDNRAGAALPCTSLNASASFAETGIETAGGKLVLTSTGADLPGCTSTLNVVDRLGYGVTPVVCNESFNASQPGPSTSVQRFLNSPDTDNNLSDFTAGASATPCAGLSTPSAASVNVGGRVTNSAGVGISKVVVTLLDGTGSVRTIHTSPFGYYNFADVEVGNTLVLSVHHKRHTFAEPTRVVQLSDEITAADFTAN